MFIGVQKNDFKHLSLCQPGPNRNPSPLIEWATLVISFDEKRN